MPTEQLTSSEQMRSIQTRVRVHGKFLYTGEEKLYLRGVTYGPFRPQPDGSEYGPPEQVDRDFEAMAGHAINCVRTYTVPPVWLLDAALEHGLRVMVGLPWEQHVTFLDDSDRARSIVDRVRAGARECAGHPAVLAYTIGNEIPSSIVRWHGSKRISRFLQSLYQAVKAEDPGALVTYVNYPTTEYLDLLFLDFLTFNVYLESPERLQAYLARLQNLAGDRPLVMAEVGLDSRRNGELAQAETLAWQVRTVFEAGCAGMFVFAWTDEWYRGGFDIEDWEFGLTTRTRLPKPALEAVAQAYVRSPFPEDAPWPRVSVVVCTYNGSRTIRDTLEALRALDYPDYEVIVVDDGSTDGVADIVSGYPVRLIRTPNRGLSSARNTGMESATGEIVAYTDDDAFPDPQWLRYLAHTFLSTDFAGLGGPNLPPPGDGPIAEAVANAPGGPMHVLLSDRVAEHVPGCNMAFRRAELVRVGGFDPRFRVAGDDVDICWRLQDAGGLIGFEPAAVVWHHRRNSVRTYIHQQRGYGKAEALLEAKWPERYDAAGHVRWAGRIYGHGLTLGLLALRERIYGGSGGAAPFQSVYAASSGNLLWYLPLMPEWYLMTPFLAGLSLLGTLWRPLLLFLPALAVAVLLPPLQAVLSARRARFPSPHSAGEERRLRALAATLHILQPAARLWGRLEHGLTPWRRRGRGFASPLGRQTALWSESWRDRGEWLQEVVSAARAVGGGVARLGGTYDSWDLEARGGLTGSARARLAVEEYGAGSQLVRLRAWPRVSVIAVALLALFLGLTVWAGLDGAVVPAAVLGGLATLIGVRIILDGGRSVALLTAASEDLALRERP